MRSQVNQGGQGDQDEPSARMEPAQPQPTVHPGSLWPVYAVAAVFLVGFAMAALGVRTCL